MVKKSKSSKKSKHKQHQSSSSNNASPSSSKKKQTPLITSTTQRSPPFGIQHPVKKIPRYFPPDREYYRLPNDSATHELATRFLFNSFQWKRILDEFNDNSIMKRALRCTVQIGTIHACISGCYHIIVESEKNQEQNEIFNKISQNYNNNNNNKNNNNNNNSDNYENEKLTNNEFCSNKTNDKIISEEKNYNEFKNSFYNHDDNHNDNDNTIPKGTVKKVHLDKKRLQRSAQKTRLYSFEQCQLNYKNQNQNNNNNNNYSNKNSNSNNNTTSNSEKNDSCSIQIINGDILDAAIWMKYQYHVKPAVLINASRSHPGGGYRRGTAAQEENLHRRTNLFMCLEDPYLTAPNREWSYPIPEFGGVFVPDALVFRGSEHKGYPFLEKPEALSFISSWAYADPPLEENPKRESRISDKFVKMIEKKIKSIFNILLQNGIRNVVLSAFGCGVYGNPPLHIAQIFRSILHLPEYRYQFKHVVFAILDIHKNERDYSSNLNAFCRVFNIDEPIKLDNLFLQFQFGRFRIFSLLGNLFMLSRLFLYVFVQKLPWVKMSLKCLRFLPAEGFLHRDFESLEFGPKFVYET